MPIEYAYPISIEESFIREDPSISSYTSEQSHDLFIPDAQPLDEGSIGEEERSTQRGGGAHESRRTQPTLKTQIEGEVLNGKEAYSMAITRETPTEAELFRYISEARKGCQEARNSLVEFATRRAWFRALRLSAYYKALRGVELDPQDIAQEAALRSLKRFDKALAHPNPVGYLYRAIEGAMLTFCRERQSAVRVPAPMQSRGHRPVEVVSLDAPISTRSSLTLGDLL